MCWAVSTSGGMLSEAPVSRYVPAAVRCSAPCPATRRKATSICMGAWAAPYCARIVPSIVNWGGVSASLSCPLIGPRHSSTICWFLAGSSHCSVGGRGSRALSNSTSRRESLPRVQTSCAAFPVTSPLKRTDKLSPTPANFGNVNVNAAVPEITVAGSCQAVAREAAGGAVTVHVACIVPARFCKSAPSGSTRSRKGVNWAKSALALPSSCMPVESWSACDCMATIGLGAARLRLQRDIKAAQV